MIKALLIIFIYSLSSSTFAKFSYGLGYIKPDLYRKDNNVNPLPLGLGVVPVITYRSERLRIFGPNIRYSLIKGMWGFDLKMNVTGDRYEAYDLKDRDTGINAGASFRFIFLSLDYESDIFKTYNGNLFRVTLAKPFHFFKRFMFLPRLGKEYLNSSFTNYYYGVAENESLTIPTYSLDTAVNDFYGFTLNYKMSENHALSLNLSHKIFDREIVKSPTIDLDRYNTISIFWSYIPN